MSRIEPRLGCAAAWAVAIAVLPAVTSAQVRAGGEFRVNTYTPGWQYGRVALHEDGSFIAVWQSGGGQDGSGFGVFAQRYDSAGAPRGAEFRVNTNTTSDQFFPDVAVQPGGGFVVTWTERSGDDDVIARRFDSSGAPRGAEFQVNTHTTERQILPSVATDAAGNFVVAWQSVLQDGDGEGVFAQRYDAAGSPRGTEFRVNTYTTSSQFSPAVAAGGGGNFVVVWEGYDQDGAGRGVFGQAFDAAGAPIGAEFRANTYTTLNQGAPDVAVGTSGTFVVVWHNYAAQDGSSRGVFAQRFSSAATPQGAEFQVNAFTSYEQGAPSASVDVAGNFVVTWQGFHQDGSDYGIFGQRFDPSGARRGAEFRVNTYTTGHQLIPVLGADSSGNFAIMWASEGQDGSGLGAFAQRFGGLVATMLAVDTTSGGSSNGNGVFEPGESVDVRPSWRNVNGTAQTFVGSLFGFGGPPGPVYAVGDPSGSYGTVATGAVAACTDCYGISVSNPPVRPSTHWDSSAIEGISPEAQGQRKRWLFHVGHSFTDVPPSSPFYRFIETLLHRAVTGGCAAGQYCPASSTARNQMAVFVLVAKEGPGYVPPVCGPTPMFTDVPAADPFCRWIEELARRDVSGGCGDGNYCPNESVSREQMAVFVLRTLDPALNPPACVPPNLFADVPETSPFCRWIEELARRGVVTGCDSANYCPAQAVTREQMGVFLGVTFGLMLYGP